MPMFRGKPVTVEAVQLNWKNWSEVCDLLGDEVKKQGGARSVYDYSDQCGEAGPNYMELTLQTLNGPVVAKHGDWIIKGTSEFYPCHPIVFEAKYGLASPVAAKDEAALESEIQAKGLNAPRLTPEMIHAQIARIEYYRLRDTTLIMCFLTLKNGFIVTGEARPASDENFDATFGRTVALNNAREKIWELEGYALRNVLAAREAHGDRVEARQAD